MRKAIKKEVKKEKQLDAKRWVDPMCGPMFR